MSSGLVRVSQVGESDSNPLSTCNVDRGKERECVGWCSEQEDWVVKSKVHLYAICMRIVDSLGSTATISVHSRR